MLFLVSRRDKDAEGIWKKKVCIYFCAFFFKEDKAPIGEQRSGLPALRCAWGEYLRLGLEQGDGQQVHRARTCSSHMQPGRWRGFTSVEVKMRPNHRDHPHLVSMSVK